jgi:hypothetical protein
VLEKVVTEFETNYTNVALVESITNKILHSSGGALALLGLKTIKSH